jgi:hypothetical protein
VAKILLDVDGGFGHKLAPRLLVKGGLPPRVYVSNSARLLDICDREDPRQTIILVPVYPEASDLWILENMRQGDLLFTRDLKLLDAFQGKGGRGFNMCRRYAIRRALSWLNKIFP